MDSKPIFTIQTYLEREEKRLSEQKNHSGVVTENGTPTTRKESPERIKSKRQAAPPPPPPLPVGELVDKVKPGKKQAPPPPSPPYCPTPDYDTASLASVPNGKQKGDIVEMQSLESFQLTNPTTPRPKPPSTYFPTSPLQHNGFSSTASTMVLRDNSKPLVTIREYPGGKERKNPAKLDFLHNPPPPPSSSTGDQPISSRLHSELAQTLSRATTLTKNEEYGCDVPLSHQNGNSSKGTIVTINVSSQNKSDTNSAKPFYLFQNGNGVDNKKLSTLITAAANRTKPTTLDPPPKNSVTFNFNHKGQEVRNGHGQKNGILKNGNNNNNNVSQVQIQSQIDKFGVQKSIKFGGM